MNDDFRPVDPNMLIQRNTYATTGGRMTSDVSGKDFAMGQPIVLPPTTAHKDEMAPEDVPVRDSKKMNVC